MGSLNPRELTLDFSLSTENWVPKSTSEFLYEVSRTQSASEKVSKLGGYVDRLQEEMKKIDAFKRELPLCMLLLADAIATMNKELIQCKSSIAEPIMVEELIPLKKKIADERDEGAEEIASSNTREKMDWMSSFQLWNSGSNPCNAENYSYYKFLTAKPDNSKKRKEELISRPSVDDLFSIGGNQKNDRALISQKGCNLFPGMILNKERTNELPGVTELSLLTTEIQSPKQEISRSGSSSATNAQSNVKQQTNRKQRRCWSTELHRRFVCVLQQLGGPQAATPKQIRELMQVDGLTNDEVKSHLQKYRLHTRRVKPSNSQSGSPQDTVTSATGANSLEDEEDEKWESHNSWRSHNQISKKVV